MLHNILIIITLKKACLARVSINKREKQNNNIERFKFLNAINAYSCTFDWLTLLRANELWNLKRICPSLYLKLQRYVYVGPIDLNVYW